MSVGRRHVVVCFQAPGPDERVPLLRSAVYEWSRVDNSGMVRLLVDFGHYNDAEGDVTIETRGKLELRRFELLADALRVHQDDGSWIEFEIDHLGRIKTGGGEALLRHALAE